MGEEVEKIRELLSHFGDIKSIQITKSDLEEPYDKFRAFQDKSMVEIMRLEQEQKDLDS